MRHNKQWNLWLTRGSKALTLVVLLAVVFSPVGQILSTPVAHAQSGNILLANSECKISDNWDICLTNIVYFVTVGLGSSLAYVSAHILNLSVSLSLNSSIYALDFISLSWASVRDIANMFFILILVYIAFTVMFRADTADTMKRLAWVVAIALIINFSFFFVRVVIDAGNLLAVQFYNQLDTSSTECAAYFQSLCPAETKDLTASIMNAVKVQQLLSPEVFNTFYTTTLAPESTPFWTRVIVLSFIYICVGVIFWTLFTVFLSVAIKFIVRIVLLWFAIIASPLALVARAVYQGPAKTWYDQWQDMLIKNAFYPAFFLFIYLILVQFTDSAAGSALAGGDNFIGQFTSAGTNFDSNAGLVAIGGTVANSGIVLAFVTIVIYVALKFADRAGTYGSTVAHNLTSGAWSVGRWGAGRGLGLGFRGIAGGGAFAGRNTLGRLAYGAVESGRAKEWASRRGLWGVLGRTTQSLSGATFDVRNAPGGGLLKKGLTGVDKVMGTAGVDVGLSKINVGKGSGRNFAKTVKEKGERYEKEGKALKPSAVEIREAQDRFQASYDAEHGPGEYTRTTTRIREYIERQRAQQQDWLRQAELADNPSMKQMRTNTAKTHGDNVRDSLKELAALEEAGKRRTEESSKERIRSFAERLAKTDRDDYVFNPSYGRIEGAAKVRKLATEKSAKDKLAEAARQVHRESEEEATTPPTPPPSPTTAPRTRQATDAALNSGPLKVMDTSVKEGIDKLIRTNKNLQKRIEYLAEAAKKPEYKAPEPNFKVVKNINERLVNIEDKLEGRTSTTSPTTTSGTIRNSGRAQTTSTTPETPPQTPPPSNKPPAENSGDKNNSTI